MTEIPFHLLRDGMPIIILPAYINGEGPFDFVLDTGNATGRDATVLVSEALGRRFGLEASDSDDFRDTYSVGDGRRTEIRRTTIASFALGEIVRLDGAVGITAMLDQLGESIGARIDGNIGYTFLKDYAVFIDYEAGILRLDDGDRTAQGESFRLAPEKPLVIVPALVNGRGPYDFAVDTGAGHTVISARLAEELALERGAEVAVRGGSGDTRGFMTRIDLLTAAGAACTDVQVVVSGFFPALNAAAGTELDGVIGYNILRHHGVMIDYPRSTILLSERVVDATLSRATPAPA